MKKQTKAKGRAALQALSRAYKMGGSKGVGRVLAAGGHARKRNQMETKTVTANFLGTDATGTALVAQKLFENGGGAGVTAIPTEVYWLYHINKIAAGTSAVQRVGKRVKMQNLHIRLTLCADNRNTTAVCGGIANRLVAATPVTVLLIYDRKPATPANWPMPGDVLTDSSLTRGHPFTNLDTAPRFKILKRWDMNLGQDYNRGNAATWYCSQSTPTMKTIDEMVSLHGLETEWTAGSTAGTYNEIVVGGLFLLFSGEFQLDASQTINREAGLPYVRSILHRLYYKDP